MDWEAPVENWGINNGSLRFKSREPLVVVEDKTTYGRRANGFISPALVNLYGDKTRRG
jgi:hypothetical protein